MFFSFLELKGFEPGPARTRAGGLTHASAFLILLLELKNAPGCVETGIYAFLKGKSFIKFLKFLNLKKKRENSKKV